MDSGRESYKRYLSGDESGLVEIIRDYKDGLILYLASFVGDIYTAEDICEDTFVKIGIKRPPDKGKASFKSWLYAIGRNTAIDYLRKERRGVNVSLDDIVEVPDRTGADDLERQYVRGEQKRHVRAALDSLKPAYRQILWLTYFENFTNKESAAVMKKSVHAVETLLYRAKRALKEKLETEGFTYEEL